MKVVSAFVVLSLIVIGLSPMTANALTYYWNPEIYEDSSMLSYGDTIYRIIDMPSSINIVVRKISDGNTENGLNVRLKILSSSNMTMYDETEITSNYTITNPNFYYANFALDEDEIPIGSYTMFISCHSSYGYSNSTYYLVMETGATFETPVPLSVTFLRNSIESGEEVNCVVIANINVTYIEFINPTYAVSMSYVGNQRWECAVLFQSIGNVEFTISIIDKYNYVYDYEYSVYVVSKTEVQYIPTIRVFDNGDETYTTIVKSLVWFSSGVYKEGPTWHIIAEFGNNIILDMTTAEPSTIERNLWFYDYTREEIQVIVSGVISGVGITYIFDDMGLKVGNVFSDIKIKGVNDWRNLWGLLGEGFIMTDEQSMIAGGIYNIDYVNSFGFFTAERTLVVKY